MSARITRRVFALVAGLLLGLAALPPAVVAADELVIFAAASLKNAMDEIAAGFAEQTGHTAVVSLAGSSALARQIEQGAPADIFISASPDWMDKLEVDGLIADGTRFDLVGNSLVLIAHGTDAAPVEVGLGMDLAAMLGSGRLAMALVDAVPAGVYGKAALTSLGLWDGLAPKVAQADNVRAALALVAMGEAPLGIVYASDALAEDGVTVVGTFPPESHPPIVYPAAIVADSDNAAASAAFLDYLRGAAAREAFERQGFVFIAD